MTRALDMQLKSSDCNALQRHPERGTGRDLRQCSRVTSARRSPEETKFRSTTMSRLNQLDPEYATGHAKELLGAVKTKLGIVPNMTRAMANSPAALDGYLQLNGALSKGTLSAKLREQIALTVSQAND